MAQRLLQLAQLVLPAGMTTACAVSQRRLQPSMHGDASTPALEQTQLWEAWHQVINGAF